MSDTDLVDSTSLKLVPGVDRGADVGQLHEHDVAERVLRVVGDADADLAVLEPGPLVVLRVAQVVGHVHARTLYPPSTSRRG